MVEHGESLPPGLRHIGSKLFLHIETVREVAASEGIGVTKAMGIKRQIAAIASVTYPCSEQTIGSRFKARKPIEMNENANT